MNKGNIHRIIFRNLSLGGIVISLIAGALVYLIEYNRIDNYISKLALDDSKIHFEPYLDYCNAPSESSLSRLRQSIQKKLRQERFILVEIYDKNIDKIVMENLDTMSSIKAELDSAFPDFIMTGQVAHKKAIINGQQYIKVMSPIRDPSTKNIIGHFEGIYHVDDNTNTMIKNRILFSVMQSVVIVLSTTILLYPLILQLNKNLARKSYKLLESNIHTLKLLGAAIATRDSDTNAHNYRVTFYSVKLAEALGIGKAQIQSLIKGAFLHDVGKIGISDNILLKPGKLTPDEMETMKQHVSLGIEITTNNRWLDDTKDVILYHHEKVDGSGYPCGLKNEDIPVNARIFAIADCFDALTSRRPYKNAISFDTSMSMLQKESGTHFDASILLKFEKISKTLYTEVNALSDEKSLSHYLDSHISRYFTIRT